MNDPFEARVYRHPDSPFWRARFRVWDASSKAWRWRTQSTKEPNESAALAIAREFAAVARKAAPAGGRTTLTREDVLDSLNAILRIAGVPTVQETVGWKSHAHAWLEAKKTSLPDGSRTVQAYQTHIKKFTAGLSDEEQPLNQFTPTQIRQWQTSLIESGLTGSTVNAIAQTIGTIFRQAVAEGLLPRNPMDLVSRVDEDAREKEPLTAEDVTRLLDHLRRSKQTDWLTATLLGLCTGQRLLDCTNALWTQIDRTKKPWWIWSHAQRKTRAKVHVPLVDPLSSHLRTLRPNDSLYLCPSLAGRPAGSGHGGLSWEFIELLEASGVKGKVFAAQGAGHTWRSKSFHSLRHTCNSILANAGVSMDVRRAILGHASDAMNAHYTHLEIETSGRALTGAMGEALARKP